MSDDDKPELTVIEGGGGDAPAAKPGKQRDLTSKQHAFVQAILKGQNQSEAYRSAYSTANMSDAAVYTEAGRLFRHPLISQRITSGRKAQEGQALHTGASLRGHIERELFGLSTTGSEAGRIRSLELLGKLDKVAAFTERTADVSGEQTADEVADEIAELLAASDIA
jgi:hypothetical protein